MSEWSARFTDFLTGQLLVELPFGGITLADPLGSDGTFDWSINCASDIARKNAVPELITAYRTAVFVIRRTADAAPTVPWAGQVLTDDYDSSSKTLDLSCSQIWQWVGPQLIEQDFRWDDIDQFDIVRDLLGYALNRPNANIPINLGAGQSGIRRTKDWRQRQGKTVAERLDPMAQRTNGPLLQFDGEYRTAIATRFLLRQIISDNPPAANAQRRLVFDFPNGNISAYHLKRDGTELPVTNTKARAQLVRTIPDPKLNDIGNWTISQAINTGFKKNDLVQFDACNGNARYYVAEQDMAPRSNRRNRGTWSLATSNSETNPYLQGDVVLYDDPDTDAVCALYYVATADIQHNPDLDAHAASPVRLTGWGSDDISPEGDSRWNEINAKDRFVDVKHPIHDRESNDDLLSEGWPRRTIYESLDDTRDRSDVTDAAISSLRGKGHLANELTVQLAPDADPVYGTYRTGDYVWVQINDDIGQRFINKWGQIVQLDTTPLPSGGEQVVATLDVTQ